MITYTDSRHDYFRYKISHFDNQTGWKYFPKEIQEYFPLVLDEELKRCEAFERENTNMLENED